MRKLLDYNGLAYFYKKLKMALVTWADFILYKNEAEQTFQRKCFYVTKKEVSSNETLIFSDNGAVSETTYRIKNVSSTSVTVTFASPTGYTLVDMVGQPSADIPAGKYCEVVVTQWDDSIMTYNLGVQND